MARPACSLSRIRPPAPHGYPRAVDLPAAILAASEVSRTSALRLSSAWMALLMTSLVGLVVLLAVMRQVRRPLRERKRKRPTPFIDAWAEAGRRMQAPGSPDSPGGDADGRDPGTRPVWPKDLGNG